MRDASWIVVFRSECAPSLSARAMRMSRGRHEGSVEARLLRPGVGCWVPLADVSRVRDAALGFARAEHLGGLVRSDETQVDSGDGIALGARRRTRLDQVAPAIAALGRHGLAAFMFFMYGFRVKHGSHWRRRGGSPAR
jgi:hypothetical protein